MDPDMIVFGDMTLKNLLIYGGAAIGALFLLSMIRKLFKKPTPDKHTQFVRCDCGWQGQVSQYVGRCPKCNAPIGEQKAKGRS
ncbi:hypothetical protein DENIS_2614 [Desulfonema ishimotonii]|uniref:Uncharacterized protein n=1 Tax=Desulfonema ishimotonii TaxID=45657 RepID=A0A401FXC1_9BACT|nr:hypothetical protein [Desulfonema ishimotonii]GBC61652.1 hypothetical protein DENIS_2614 [Desulfonema ishimotonii]